MEEKKGKIKIKDCYKKENEYERKSVRSRKKNVETLRQKDDADRM